MTKDTSMGESGVSAGSHFELSPLVSVPQTSPPRESYSSLIVAPAADCC